MAVSCQQKFFPINQKYHSKVTHAAAIVIACDMYASSSKQNTAKINDRIIKLKFIVTGDNFPSKCITIPIRLACSCAWWFNGLRPIPAKKCPIVQLKCS